MLFMIGVAIAQICPGVQDYTMGPDDQHRRYRRKLDAARRDGLPRCSGSFARDHGRGFLAATRLDSCRCSSPRSWNEASPAVRALRRGDGDLRAWTRCVCLWASLGLWRRRAPPARHSVGVTSGYHMSTPRPLHPALAIMIITSYSPKRTLTAPGELSINDTRGLVIRALPEFRNHMRAHNGDLPPRKKPRSHIDMQTTICGVGAMSPRWADEPVVTSATIADQEAAGQIARQGLSPRPHREGHA